MKTRSKKVRFNTRVPSELLKWAQAYAKRKNTTVTQLLVDFLTSKKEMENGKANVAG